MGKTPCCEKNGLKKGPWTPEEDQKLIDYIQKHGHGKWRTLPKNAGLQRCGKSCRLRWTNYLRPDIKRGMFTFEEEENIIQLHSILGNKWSAIAARLPGRTDNEIKNYWNTHIRKKLLKMGIDPVTHTPCLNFLQLSSVLSSNSVQSSSQLNFPTLLGTRPLFNPNLLNLVTALLSSTQCKNPSEIFSQSFYQQNNLPQNMYQLPINDQQNPIQEIQSCTTSTTSNAQFLSETQFVQSQLDQFSTHVSNFEYPDNVFEPTSLGESYIPIQNYGYFNQNSDQPFTNCSSKEQTLICKNIDENVQNLSFGSVLSPPSSSMTPLNSSPTTYINGGTGHEDYRDSNYSNILLYGVPDSLNNVHGIM